MRQITFLFLVVFIKTITFGATPDEQFTQGVEACEAGKYQAAIEQWSSLNQAGLESFDLYYNMGNAYFKKGNYPYAILYFEKALKLKPLDKEGRHNLDLANQQIVKSIKPLPEFFLKKLWRNTSSFFSANVWSWLTLILFWIGITLIVVKLLDWGTGSFKNHYVVGGTAIFLSVLFLSLGMTKAGMEYDARWAIVLDHNKELMSAPESTVDVMELPEGTKLEIIDKIGSWEKVKAPNGEVGWIEEHDATKI